MNARLLNLLRHQGVALLALFVALGGTSFAVTARNGHRDRQGRHVILGCVGKNTGTLRVVDSFIRCGSLETPISFNREGRPGERGPKGPRGHVGHRGRHGARGRTGATGATGATGLRGAAGERGPTGADGERGPAGADGAPGPVGANGAEGLDALTATAAEPAGANCATGGVKLTSGIDVDRNGTLDPGEVNDAATRYVCNGAEGATGEKGDTGATGAKGDPGDPGATGAKGDPGDPGATGAKGDPGDPGATGAKGDTGATGAKGDTGATGAKGDPGATGAKGDPGATGAAGQSVTSTPEPPGTNCANGGVRYTSVSGVSFVCNGTGGSDTAAQTLAKLLTVDGSGSGLDADTLDGIDSAALVRRTQFGDLFNSSLDGLFGTDDSTASNDSPDLGSHFLAEVYLTAADFPPNGTEFAAGQLISISSNSALFTLIGTTYGGNGTTTFALPDLRQQAPGGLHYVIQTSGVFPSRP